MSRSATVSTRWSRRLMRKGGILPFEEAGCKAYVGTRHHGPSAPALCPKPLAGRVRVEDERSHFAGCPLRDCSPTASGQHSLAGWVDQAPFFGLAPATSEGRLAHSGPVRTSLSRAA